jgi:DNA-binding transcriptional ArsR family regulator
MARAATTSDVFNAIAEPCRREILSALGRGESPVADLVTKLRLSQPQVSKHLGVLRRVGVVRCRSVGRQRLYRVHAPALQPIHDWVSIFEQQWNERFDRLDDYLVALQANITNDGTNDRTDKDST